MNKLNQSVRKWSCLVKAAHMNRNLPSSFYSIRRSFSAEASETASGSSGDPFAQLPTSGFVYGRLTNNLTSYTMESDIVNLLEGCDLKPENIRFEYNRLYFPISALIEFPSRAAFDIGFKAITRKGKLHNLARGDKSQFDLNAPYDGKALLLRGIPRNALADDIECFLSGCQFYASTMEIFLRAVNQKDVKKMAIVRFPSHALALHAYITKNKGFCLNDQITLQLLH